MHDPHYNHCFEHCAPKVLLESRSLQRVWRVGYQQADNEIAPRKPLYFWRKPFCGKEMAPNTCYRLF